MRFQKLLERFNDVVSKLQDQLVKMPGVAPVPNKALMLLVSANNMTEIVKEGGEKEINPKRFADFVDATNRVIREMKFLEREHGFFTKGSATRELRKEIASLDSGIYRKHQIAIEGKFSMLETLSSTTNTSLDDLKAVFKDAHSVIEGARIEGTKSRIQLVLTPTPSKPSPDQKRSKRLRDAEIRSSMRGSSGNGKKSNQKQASA